jgi:hypothetical protein
MLDFVSILSVCLVLVAWSDDFESVYYLYLSITSLWQLARLPPISPARRILFPYTLGLLVINTGFAISQNIVIEAVTIEGPWGSWLPDVGCNPNLVFRTIFLALPIFMNDLLFVRSYVTFYTSPFTQYEISFIEQLCWSSGKCA